MCNFVLCATLSMPSDTQLQRGHPHTPTMLQAWNFALLFCCLSQPALSSRSSQDNCAGSGAKVRQLLLYDLKASDTAVIAAVNKLFQQRLEECDSVLYPGSSYGAAAFALPEIYGFPPSRPMPVSATIADWAGWMDFHSLDGLRKCLKINNRTGTLKAMRALAQPNGRYDLIIRKNTLPGSRGDPCPFPDSYAPATIRYIFAYILPPGVDRPATCRKGAGLWHRMLRTGGSDVRHGTSCSLLPDEEARSYGIAFNSGFGGYVDFEGLRDMTRYLASNNPSIQANRKQLRALSAYTVRAAVALPWSGR